MRPLVPAAAVAPASFAWRTAREAALLLAGALALAAIVGTVHPRRPDWRLPYPSSISPAAVHDLPRSVLWVDARGRLAFLAAHIHDAVPLDEDRWNELLPAFLDRWQPGVAVVVYCGNRTCGDSLAVARRLQRELRIEHVYTLEGGWTAWTSQAK